MYEQKVREILAKDQFVSYIGVTLEEVGDGTATARLKLQPYHLNGAGLIQGGAVFTLADFTMAAVANSTGRIAVTSSAQISYLKPANGEFLIARGKMVAESRSLGTIEVNVYNDKEELVARLNGTAFRTKQEL